MLRIRNVFLKAAFESVKARYIVSESRRLVRHLSGHVSLIKLKAL